jgi:hypothetical protein
MPPKRKPAEQPELHGGWKVWNANSAAAKAIKEGLADESIDLNATPKQVWESNTLLQEYKLDTFCTHYAKEKTRQGTHIHDDNKKENKDKGKYICSSLYHFV